MIDSVTRVRLLLVAILLLCIGSEWAIAAEESFAVRLVAGSDSPLVVQTTIHLGKLLRSYGIDVQDDPGEPAHTSRSRKQLVVTVGISAWRSVTPSVSPEDMVVGVLVPAYIYDQEAAVRRAKTASVLISDPPPGRMLNLIRAAFPRISRVALVASQNLLPQVPKIEALAAERDLQLTVEKIRQESDVGPAVERLVRRGTVLVALPDGIVHNANTVQPLLLIAYRNGVPVVGYSESYLRAGAALAVYSTAEQIAQQAVEMVKSFLDGKSLPAIQSPRYFSVGVNRAVATSMDLNIPTAEELTIQLRQMRE